MNIWLFIFGLLLFFLSLFLILIVLVQRGRGGGLTGALGGMGGQSAFGAKAGDTFTRITVVTAVLWILLSMATIKIYNPPMSSDQTANDGVSSGAGAAESNEDGTPPSDAGSTSSETTVPSGAGESNQPPGENGSLDALLDGKGKTSEEGKAEEPEADQAKGRTRNAKEPKACKGQRSLSQRRGTQSQQGQRSRHQAPEDRIPCHSNENVRSGTQSPTAKGRTTHVTHDQNWPRRIPRKIRIYSTLGQMT